MMKHRVIGEWIRGLVIVHCCICTLASEPEKTSKCLTGYMTDVQSWVDKAGGLKLEKDIQHAIDLSANVNPVPMLHQKMTLFRAMQRHVKYLSLARCKLTRVPPIFHMMDTQGLDLADTIEYMTFFGNKFITFSEAGKQYGSTLNATQATDISLHNMYKIREPMLWTSGFKNVKFSRLKELDLRACSIKILAANTFNGMNSLEALYLGENEIYEIDSRAFNTVQNLVALDISQNVDLDDDGNIKNLDLNFPSYKLSRLTSLNLSYTKLRLRNNFKTLRDFGKSLKSLSVCETGLANLPEGIFNNTSLQILDLSRNKGILSNTKALRGLENTLQILYAKDIGLQSMDMFQNFTKLEILKLSSNEISLVTERTVKKLYHLKVLDLNMNKLTMWFERTFTYMPKLEILSLIENNINLITEQMIQDIANISYVALSGNFIVCNCHVKDFYKIALINEDIYNNTLIKVPKNQLYHRGYKQYNNLINSRTKVNFTCDNTCDVVEDGGVFRLLDFGPGAYMCLELPGSKSVPFYVIDGCSKVPRLDYDNELDGGRRKLMILLLIPCVLLPALILFLFRRNIRYCFITLRNSAMIGLINKNDYINDDTIFNYDVFVSYCNEDRGWVLDHLLPHIETDYSISVCLHERDFQVGLSILENIVSCMDRSRSIMLIISQRFLLSQWCQFEMHLAQHRLLETRREDLTLVLLEDIPRRLRPNTLHYLMLTKTYIVWPKQESERALFWKRIKKTLLSQKAKKEAQNVSLA